MRHAYRFVIAGAALVLAVMLLAPSIDDRSRPTAADSPRTVVASTDGATNYELSGPTNGMSVVLVHGVSGPMKVWDRLVPSLIAAGYRVLRYDLFGRGLSDRIAGQYDEALFGRQLLELTRETALTPPFVIIGSSMGAIVSTGFAQRHPELVRALVLIGPAGFPIHASPAARLLDVPLVGAALMALVGGKLLPEHHRKYFVRPDTVPEMHAAFAAQLAIRGTKRAIRETMTSMPVNDFHRGYEAVGQRGLPVQLLWGVQDVTFPFAHHRDAQRMIRKAQFTAIEGAAHLPQYEQADATLAALLPFLATTAGKR